jgi:hypothetical protein
MKTSPNKLKANKSGQLLVIAALVIGILISSTTIYVYEVSKETNSKSYVSISNLVLALKQSTRNAMISSLANASNGGENTVLKINLYEFSQTIQTQNHLGTCYLSLNVFSGSNYDDGIRLSWNTTNQGLSSAYSNFTLRTYDEEENITLSYAVNVTTAISFSGSYSRLVGNEKQVNLTCNLYNEGEPALAQRSAFFYELAGEWITVDSSNNLSIIDHGNGRYDISFTVSSASDIVEVSAHAYDLRGIFVSANTTCYEA